MPHRLLLALTLPPPGTRLFLHNFARLMAKGAQIQRARSFLSKKAKASRTAMNFVIRGTKC